MQERMEEGIVLHIEQLNTADYEWCVQQLGGIFEHSPWIVRTAMNHRPFHSADDLFQTMKTIVLTAAPQQKEQLILAHPRLGSKEKLTAQSEREQQQAGLSRMEKTEAADFAALNAAYERRFDFPFILAVHGRSRQEINRVLHERLKNSRPEEVKTAIDEIITIARFRFDDLMASGLNES